MDEAMTRIKAAGYKSAYAMTNHTNRHAIHLFQKYGFKTYNTIHYTKLYPYYYDQYEMKKCAS